jgi:hypothetical protein
MEGEVGKGGMQGIHARKLRRRKTKQGDKEKDRRNAAAPNALRDDGEVKG